MAKKEGAMKSIIRTVRGDISPDELGFCDCHCHPLVISDRLSALDASKFDVRDIAIAKKELLKFKAAGGNSLLDCQPLGTGRATEEDLLLSIETSLHIVACTGFHMQNFYDADHWTFTSTEQSLTDVYVSEITEGMFLGTETGFPERQTASKAGFIKNATEEPDFDAADARRLTAAAKAQLITGAPLLCHTNKSALTHIPFFLKLGVDPKSIIVAHLDKSRFKPEDYHLKIAQLGVYLEFDSIVNSRYGTKEEEIDLIKTMLEKGYGKQLMLGSDPVRTSYPSYNPDGGEGLDYIPLVFCERLRNAGVSQAEIDDMTVNVPKEALSFVPKA